MKHINFVLLITMTTINMSCNETSDSHAKHKTSPFSSFSFVNKRITVELEGSKYTFLKMDTLSANELLNQFKEEYEEDWQKRFSEDFVEYSNRLNIYPKTEERFTLLNDKGEEVILNVRFTKEKRIRAKQFYEERLINTIISKAEAEEDLNQLHQLITDKYSYYFLNSVDIDKEIQDIRDQLPENIKVYDFALLVNRLLNKFGDGHSRIGNISFREYGKLPFKTCAFKDEIICYNSNGLLENDFPYLKSINGVSATDLWTTSEELLTPDGSPQFKKSVSAGRLNRIGVLLRQLDRYDEMVNVELKGKDGGTKTITAKIKEKPKLSLSERTRMLKELNRYNPLTSKKMDNIGYLKIESMIRPKETELSEMIEKIKDSEAVIIDVRGNGGGSRQILLELAPHFISAKQDHIIGNLARLRTDQPEINTSMADRYIYHAKDEHFSEKEQANIRAFQTAFTPSVRLDDNLYSPYYFLYIKGREDAYFANTPTVVLMDEGCFSATDIFLSSFKQIDNVTLIGTKSGGGSGRREQYELNNSTIKLTLSTMVSYQPDGSLYDGVGVSPDIIVEKENVSDVMGTTDNQLDFAIDYLNKLMK